MRDFARQKRGLRSLEDRPDRQTGGLIQFHMAFLNFLNSFLKLGLMMLMGRNC